MFALKCVLEMYFGYDRKIEIFSLFSIARLKKTD